MDVKYKIWTVLFLVIVVGTSTGILNAMYIYTDPIARKNERLKLYRYVLEVLEIPYKESDTEQVFRENIVVNTQTVKGVNLYMSKAGVAFEVSGPGFWGQISTLIALEPDLETIKGLKVLKHSETPGLGERITEDWFQYQFKGKKLTSGISIVTHKGARSYKKAVEVTSASRVSKPKNEVDAISGATETSKSFEKMINNSFRTLYPRLRRLKKD